MDENSLIPAVPKSKRILDLCITIPGLFILSPLILIISVLVLYYHGPPIIFRQKRPGFRGGPFHLLKFRSMTNAKDEQGVLLPDSDRLTPLGRFLRSYSLDELPEFFNVLNGEMSLVGPRPLLMQYLDRYSTEQARRHHVLPGITGWAQINGRNTLSWDDKFRHDVWYVDHWSLWLDMRILFISIWKVIRREGINQPGHVTSEEFMGNHKNKSTDLDESDF
jgi:lipopolysaccharide/colanic/teichoic acid biosynthesis glycosyltransferase